MTTHCNSNADDVIMTRLSTLPFAHASERELALSILHFPSVISNAVESLMPHVLCDHVHTIAQRFHSYYSNNRVLPRATDPVADGCDVTLLSRVVLCAATDVAIRQAMQLLGVECLDKI